MLEPWLPIQQGPGQPGLQKNIMIFQRITMSVRERWRPDRTPFSARRQDLPSWIHSKIGIG
jgi:hypothetical protein